MGCKVRYKCTKYTLNFISLTTNFDLNVESCLCNYFAHKGSLALPVDFPDNSRCGKQKFKDGYQISTKVLSFKLNLFSWFYHFHIKKHTIVVYAQTHSFSLYDIFHFYKLSLFNQAAICLSSLPSNLSHSKQAAMFSFPHFISHHFGSPSSERSDIFLIRSLLFICK